MRAKLSGYIFVSVCRYGSDSWKFLKKLYLPATSNKNVHFITTKRTYDAFHGTELPEILENAQVDSLIISGVMTNLVASYYFFK